MIKLVKNIGFKRIWWLLLLFLCIHYIRLNIDTISINPNTIDLIIICITVILVFMPLISEISFMGMSLKKEIKSTKKEMREEIYKIKNDFLDLKLSNIMNNDINIDIKGVGYLPSKESVENEMKSGKYSSPRGKQENTTSQYESVIEVAADNVFLFKARYTLESRFQKISTDLGISNSSTIRMVAELLKRNIIDDELHGTIRKILSICNRGMHGEIIDDEYIKYVKLVLPNVLEELEKLDLSAKAKPYFICSRCGYRGSSDFENECPKCGFITDEF